MMDKIEIDNAHHNSDEFDRTLKQYPLLSLLIAHKYRGTDNLFSQALEHVQGDYNKTLWACWFNDRGMLIILTLVVLALAGLSTLYLNVPLFLGLMGLVIVLLVLVHLRCTKLIQRYEKCNNLIEATERNLQDVLKNVLLGGPEIKTVPQLEAHLDNLIFRKVSMEEKMAMGLVPLLEVLQAKTAVTTLDSLIRYVSGTLKGFDVFDGNLGPRFKKARSRWIGVLDSGELMFDYQI